MLRTPALTRLILFLVLMTLTGCAASPAARPPPPSLVENEAAILARIHARCPPLGDTSALAATVARPPAPVSKAAVRAWIDRLEVSDARKGAIGKAAVAAYAACRGESAGS